MSFEPFIYLFLFLLFGLLSYVARWLKREMDGSADREAESKVYGLFQEAPEPVVYPDEKISVLERSASEVPSMAPASSKRTLKRVTIHPRNLQEMRRGIVLMTVLGPCRAIEPPNESLHF